MSGWIQATMQQNTIVGFKNLLSYEEVVLPKNGDKSCQSNSDKRSSDFGSFLVI